MIGASTSHRMQVQFHQVLRGVAFSSLVDVATTLYTSCGLVFQHGIVALALSISRLTRSLALLLAFGGSRLSFF